MKTKKVSFEFDDEERNTHFVDVYIGEEPYCEHCCTLPIGAPIFEVDNDGVGYCEGCTSANGFDFTEQELDEVYEVERKFKIKYHKKALKKLKAQ